MKVLLTGSGGMVGRNILEHSSASKFTFLSPPSTELNLLNAAAVTAYYERHRPELVIHCAGLVGGIQANMKWPVRFLVENLEMGKNILLAAQQYDVSKVINMASSCIYPKDYQGLLEEEMILTGPLEPTNEGYALAKISIMKLAQYINLESGQLRFKTFIPCNLYGRWDKFSDHNSHMIPAVIKKIHHAILNKETTVEIWGSGNARREFMYAADLANFIYFSLEHWNDVPEIINVGLGNDYSINDYYKTVADVLCYQGRFHHNLDRPEGMKCKVVSTSKSDAIGWKASTNVVDGIRQTYQFFLEQEEKK